MNFDYGVVVVGSGPAGLTAATQLSANGHRTLVLERDLFGGNLQHTGQIDDYSEFPQGILGADLAGKLIEQATSSGATIEHGDVSAIELFSRSRWVACSDGRGFSCAVVILASGTHYIRLGLANEEKFRGRGVVDCTPCDAGFFVDRDVVVYGSHNYARRDAKYLADLGCRVTMLLPERVRIDAIVGDDRLEALALMDLATSASEKLPAQGLFIRTGMEPSTAAFADTLDLDEQGYVLTNDELETSAPHVLACGDVRAGATPKLSSAVADGARAATRAQHVLARLAQV
jgi:thioredoxin reductase (NADPH)